MTSLDRSVGGMSVRVVWKGAVWKETVWAERGSPMGS